MLKRRKNLTTPPPEDCPLTTCLSIIGNTWTPNIIWYLSKGPRRFSELKSDLGRIAPKVLSQKLKKMESDGLLSRKVQKTNPPTVEYSLTSFGHEFKPVIQSAVEIGHRLKKSRR